jgi:predicted PurR-regulated permease PerM
MKSISISIIIFAAMILCIVFSTNYLNKITNNLQTLNDNLEEYVSKEQWEKAYNTSLEYTHKWENHSKIVKLFVNHQEIDNIEMELWKLPQYVKEKSKDESLASIHVLKFLLNHITNLEKINTQNIF